MVIIITNVVYNLSLLQYLLPYEYPAASVHVCKIFNFIIMLIWHILYPFRCISFSQLMSLLFNIKLISHIIIRTFDFDTDPSHHFYCHNLFKKTMHTKTFPLAKSVL